MKKKAQPNKEKLAIQKAARRCHAAFVAHPTATHAWNCHHEEFFELLIRPYENRIKYILDNKLESEQVTRLNSFRPVTNQKEFDLRSADYNAKRNELYEDYEAKRKSIGEDCEAKRNAIDADYLAKRKELQAPLMELYRADVPLGTWNGWSVFS